MADEEQTNPENDPNVEENTGAEPAQTESAPKQQEAVTSHEHRNQWILFGILAGILIGVVLAIAVMRPLIFNRIVPAVMGDFVTPDPAAMDETMPEENQPSSDESATGNESNDVENAEDSSNEVFIPAASSGDGAEETTTSEEEGSQPAAEETIPEPPAPAPVTHTVQVGDNLTKISAQYGVSVQDIMAANNLPNADYISVGQVLIIPTN